MIKINNEIIATAEQNIVITQEDYDKLTTAEKNNPLKTYFISDSSIAAQNLAGNEPAAQTMSLRRNYFAARVDDSDRTTTNDTDTEFVVADRDGNVVGPMEDQEASSTDFVDTDLIGLNIADAIGNVSLLTSYSSDGTIIGAIAELYERLGVEPDTSEVFDDYGPLTYSDYLGLIGDRTILDQYDMPNITAALMDLFDRVADAENKAEISRVNAEDAMKAQAEAEAAKAAAEKAQKEAEESKAETEKDLANATNRANNAEASASEAWKQLHDTTEELNAEKSKNERLQSELDAAKKSEETGAETPEPDKSTETEGSGETTGTETTEPGESTDTTEKGESTETSGTDQSSETTGSTDETVTDNKPEETVETPSTDSTEEGSVKEETPSETTTPATEESNSTSTDEEK